MAERHWAAEPIEIELRRVAPDALEKGELAEATGLSNDDLRGGLRQLEEEGLLDADNPDGYAWADGSVAASDQPTGELPAATAPQAAPGSVNNAAALRVPGAGPSYRASYLLSVAFSGGRGDENVRDTGARKSARELERQIADAVLQGVGVAVSVELTELAAFDLRPVQLDEEVTGGGSGGAAPGGAREGEPDEDNPGEGEGGNS